MEVAYMFPSCVWIEKLNFNVSKLKNNLDEFKKQGLKIKRSNKNGEQYDDYDNKDFSDAILKIFPRVNGKKPLKDLSVFMWVNWNPKGASNTRHTHITYTRSLLLSGVYYVKVPENSGRIRFYDPRLISSLNTPDHQYYYNSQSYNFIVPQEDMILFFPSWLEHDVEENQSNEERISIGFNIFAVPEGNALQELLYK